MRDILKAFSFLKDIENFESRNVARNEVNGLIVSTVYTSDEGYETAILDENGSYPVERYADKSLSLLGHAKWLEIAESISEITCLAGLCNLVEAKVVKLVRGEGRESKNDKNTQKWTT